VKKIYYINEGMQTIMKNLREQLIDRLYQVLHEKQSKDELIDWSFDRLYGILDSKSPLLLKELALYPFLSALSIKNLWERCSDINIQEYYDVLIGNKEMEYSCFMKNINQSKEENLSKIERLLNTYVKHKEFSENDINTLEEISIFNSDFESVDDIFYKNLLCLLNSLPKKSNYEIEINTIYVSVEELQIKNVLTRIDTMMRYLNGTECFYFSVYFNDGSYRVLLM